MKQQTAPVASARTARAAAGAETKELAAAQKGAALDSSPRALAQRRHVQAVQNSPRMAAQQVVQRAIGLEIEVPVPIDVLPDDQIDTIEKLTGPPGKIPSKPEMWEADGRRGKHGKAPYGTIAEDDKIRVDVDHDNRVMTPNPDVVGQGWPLREGGVDSIIEIVTKPAPDEKKLDEQMDEVDQLIQDIDTNTNGLTTHWTHAWGGYGVGPLDYASQGHAPVRKPNHNYDGSVQVNLGLNLSGYGDMLANYAQSTYADPARADAKDQAVFSDAKMHIEASVAAGKAQGQRLRDKHAKKLTPEHNDLRGIEGWLTHVALYLIRGSAQGVGGTMKNLAPVLLKSPSAVAAETGMSEQERDFYAANRNDIMTHLLEEVNRNKDAKWFGRWKNQKAFPGRNAEGGGDITIEQVSRIDGGEGDVLLTGKPIADPGVGNDMVAEFRTLPGYHKPADWREMGKKFLRAAEASKGNGPAKGGKL